MAVFLGLSLFPIYQEPDCFKTHPDKFGGQTFEIKVLAGCVPPADPRGQVISLSSVAAEASVLLGPCPHPFSFKAKSLECCSVLLSLSLGNAWIILEPPGESSRNSLSQDL